jgi:serine/threonine protein kinase
LHRHGVVHGDLKPQNIIVQPETHAVTLVDFGVAAVKPDASSRPAGYTESFAAPEQIARKPLLPASDFYSLGKVMIYMLSGGLDQVKRLEVPHEVPAVVQAFMKRLLKHDPLERPQENEDLWDTFKEIRLKAFGRTRTGMLPIPGL